jgi:hypothetical protein
MQLNLPLPDLLFPRKFGYLYLFCRQVLTLFNGKIRGLLPESNSERQEAEGQLHGDQ